MFEGNGNNLNVRPGRLVPEDVTPDEDFDADDEMVKGRGRGRGRG